MYDGKYNGIQGKVQIHVRILAPALGVRAGHPDAGQHADPDNNAVEGDAEPKDRYAVSQMLNGDAQIDKAQIIARIHVFTLLSAPEAPGPSAPCWALQRK